MIPARISMPFAIALVMAAVAAPAQADVVPTVTVSGVHVERIANDTATVGFGVRAERRSAEVALAVTSKRIRAVIAAVEKAGGVAPSDITTGRISVRKLTLRGDDGRRLGTRFRASQGVNVTILVVKRTGRVVSAGVSAGATVLSGPRYFVSDPDSRYRDALLRAFDAAKRKARALATRSGRTLGPVLSITEGGRMASLTGSGGAGQLAEGPVRASAPIKPGKSRVRGLVTVVFELQ